MADFSKQSYVYTNIPLAISMQQQAFTGILK
jgi:hypothetical protein